MIDIYLDGGTLTLRKTSKLASKNDYETSERISPIFEKLRCGEIIKLADGMFCLDGTLNLILIRDEEITKGKQPKNRRKKLEFISKEVKLTASQWKMVEELGDGDHSVGIRRLVKMEIDNRLSEIPSLHY